MQLVECAVCSLSTNMSNWVWHSDGQWANVVCANNCITCIYSSHVDTTQHHILPHTFIIHWKRCHRAHIDGERWNEYSLTCICIAKAKKEKKQQKWSMEKGNSKPFGWLVYFFGLIFHMINCVAICEVIMSVSLCLLSAISQSFINRQA